MSEKKGQISEQKASDQTMNDLLEIVENSFDGILVADGEGNVQFANGAYEKNTGVLIADDFEEKNRDYIAVPGVLCKNHGVFTWGKDAHEAVHNAVVVEEVAKMAARCEMINPKNQPAPQELQDKHYFRKHGANAYYGQ